MTWSYEDALNHIANQFPGCETSVEDGGDGYDVGVVENQDGAIEASFRLTFELNPEDSHSIEQIDIAEPGKFCGIVTAGESKRDPTETGNRRSQAFARLTITSQSEKQFQRIRGLVGDYEVSVPISSVDVQER